MSVEQEEQALMALLGARNPAIPPTSPLPRTQWLRIAARAVIMLGQLPPELYDEAFSHVCEDRQRRIAAGTAAVRRVAPLKEARVVLLDMERIDALAGFIRAFTDPTAAPYVDGDDLLQWLDLQLSTGGAVNAPREPEPATVKAKRCGKCGASIPSPGPCPSCGDSPFGRT